MLHLEVRRAAIYTILPFAALLLSSPADAATDAEERITEEERTKLLDLMDESRAQYLSLLAGAAIAILLFFVLGRQWILLPGLIMEAIPGLYVFPFWLLVVGAVAVWGTARPGRN